MSFLEKEKAAFLRPPFWGDEKKYVYAKLNAASFGISDVTA